MSVDSSVIAAIEAAVSASPENTPLRLHLASLLVAAGRFPEALEQCRWVLERQPAHAEALRTAELAAAGAGEAERADGYRRLRQALDESASSADVNPPPSLPTKTAPAASDEEEAGPAGASQGGNLIRMRLVEKSDEGPFDLERPQVSLSDVAGMENVKRRLDLAFLGPLRNPELAKKFRKSLKGGLLLYGPPGCGKTFIARATAGELGARFLSVGLADVLDMWFGESEKNIHEIFETARRGAPCVIFLDEIDALGRKRSLIRHAATGTGVVNQLLAELDSVDRSNEGVFVLAATNHPWDVDTALRRPGRLDRTVLVLPPDLDARVAILRLHLSDRPIHEVDLEGIAARTEDFSGADLAHLCESATELAMEASLTEGGARPIQMSDFRKALKEVRPSARPWLEMARNYAQFANEGGTYDDLLVYLRGRKLV